ncbi:chromosome segregation protein SMC, partial [bacterium]|nr:chromosome segregation protein SMC [bacterium]
MDLELRPLNILIGANGSGKSNFVAFFALLREIVEKHLQLYVGTSGGADALLHFGRKSTDEVSCRLWFAEREYRCRLVPSAGDSLVFAEEALDLRVPGFREKHKYTPTEGTNVETKLHEMDRLQVGAALGAGEVLSVLGSWRVYHFHDTSESAKVKATCDLHDNEYLRPDGANLASVLYLLQEKHRDHYRNVVDTVRMVAPFFDDFRLRPSPLNEKKIRLEWRERGTDTYFGPEALSDGSLRFICLATLLLQP